ncbi:hypothetical protein KGA65_14405 [Ideonella sp. B7]|uniref:hypothetical protein n=1 Tax=Ideonella benzenivorans TaxID=2831643 RepID=UPI001CECA719|nr:hypothetical protein [Ideonella benzenivorans]MCA6217727.1 hypothetical protein [Ideonella benzenivorans]
MLADSDAPIRQRSTKKALHSKELYTELALEIKFILRTLEDLTDDPGASGVRASVSAILEPLRRDTGGRIAELDEHAEWGTFTIAFYGETNAGKSTLIETLRILLDEPSKLHERRLFAEVQQKHGLSSEDIRAAEAAIAAAEQQLQAGAARQAQEIDTLEARVAEASRLAGEAQAAAATWKSSVNLWNRVMAILRGSPAQQAVEEKSRQLRDAAAARTQAADEHAAAMSGLRATLAAKQAALERIQSQVGMLAEHADGRIIGTGRSDFTLKSQIYNFECNGQKFALIDVPGIEGSEAKVESAIWEAVQKAHAVFYVTPKPAAPQMGDEGHNGTLQKIKLHLGSQTEVWTIYNKGATNPLALSGDKLLTLDEQRSLKELDRKLRGELGDSYAKTISVSARPAYLAVAECHVPGGSDAKARDKFMAKLPKNELLARSNIGALVELLSGKLVLGQQDKILKSNLSKAQKLVSHAHAEVSAVYEEKLKPYKAELNGLVRDSSRQLDLSADALVARLEVSVVGAVDSFVSGLRASTYKYIDGDVANDDLRVFFRKQRDNLSEVLGTELKREVEAELVTFREEIANSLERFRQFAEDLQVSLGDLTVAGKSAGLKLEFPSGVDWISAISALVGGALLFWNPIGWYGIAAGAVSLVISAAKALYGVISSDYKKAQQRKAIDQQLGSIRDSALEAIREQVERCTTSVLEQVDLIKQLMSRPLVQAGEVNKAIKKSIDKLQKLAGSLEPQGVE